MGLPNYVGHLTPEQIRVMKRNRRGTIFYLLVLGILLIVITALAHA